MKKVLVVCPNPSVDIYAWVEGFENGIPNRIKKEERYPGGKGLHVAMALAEMEIPVTVAGFWGGEAGSWIKKACNQYYPSISFIGPELDDWSRSCYTFKSNDDFDDTEILGPGPVVTKSDFRMLQSEIDLELPYTEMMALCGSWPKGSPENGYGLIIEQGKDQGVPSFLDCTGVQLKNGLDAEPFGVHLNKKEITEFFKSDFESSKEQLLLSCRVAAVTDGSKGLHLISNEETHHALAKIEKVISTIGSGDCLTAGVIAGYMKNLPMADIAKLGASCGAANCLRKELGMLYAKDVEELVNQQS